MQDGGNQEGVAKSIRKHEARKDFQIASECRETTGIKEALSVLSDGFLSDNSPVNYRPILGCMCTSIAICTYE